MRDTLTRALVLLAVLGLRATLERPLAQGLGEVARREAARRQQTGAGKKYTNEDLPATAPVAAPPSRPAADPAVPQESPREVSGTAAAAAPATEAATDAGVAPPPPREKRDEKYWRDRSSALREKMRQGADTVKALESRAQQLGEALKSGGGSSHTAELEVTTQALAEARTNADYLKDEWTRMETRAQAAQVPAEWLK